MLDTSNLIEVINDIPGWLLWECEHPISINGQSIHVPLIGLSGSLDASEDHVICWRRWLLHIQ